MQEKGARENRGNRRPLHYCQSPGRSTDKSSEMQEWVISAAHMCSMASCTEEEHSQPRICREISVQLICKYFAVDKGSNRVLFHCFYLRLSLKDVKSNTTSLTITLTFDTVKLQSYTNACHVHSQHTFPPIQKWSATFKYFHFTCFELPEIKWVN